MAQRQLNVRDALAYLDKVKQQFAEDPNGVYAEFLEVMRHFKCQSIDTPGVIDRVATLFRDHPNLIEGFNTFLPYGYKVKAGSRNTITVTTPQGVTTTTTRNGLPPLSREARAAVAVKDATASGSGSTSAAGASGSSSAARPATSAATSSSSAAASSSATASAAHSNRFYGSQPTQQHSSSAGVGAYTSSIKGNAPGSTSATAASNRGYWNSGLGLNPSASSAAAAAGIKKDVSPAQAGSQAATAQQQPQVKRESPAVGSAAAGTKPAPPVWPDDSKSSASPAAGASASSAAGGSAAGHRSTGLGGYGSAAYDPYRGRAPSAAAQASKPGAQPKAEPARTAGAYGHPTSAGAASTATSAAPAAASSAANGHHGTTANGGASAATPAASAAPTPSPGAGAAPAGVTTPMEFNHAINYVNKIKNRFTGDPDTYKAFLEILQTYQKETRPIQEVYAQVTTLFRNAPDLLDEFKAFLPDTSEMGTGGGAAPAAGGLLSGAAAKIVGPAAAKKDGKDGAAMDRSGSRGGRAQGAALAAEAQKKRAQNRPAQQGGRVASGSTAAYNATGPAAAKRQKKEHSPPPAKGERGPSVPAGGEMVPPGAAAGGYPHAAYAPPTAPRMQSAYDSYLTHHRNQPMAQPEEFAFFERVKKYLDDRTLYTEFLKLLNLFTQGIIDLKTLMEKSLLFIGGNDDLVGQMKDIVGWDYVKDGRIEGEDWMIDNEPVLERSRVELQLMKSYGPSYRKLPDTEIELACSGRDAPDWSVLNDEWVAFATWASEGSGAHRKNIYEDALYNSEQERHWYSYHIESLARAINLFEPVAARIARLTPDERAGFKLADDFGEPSPSIHERMIRKIWGKDQSYEIIQALYDNPLVAVPLVLSRMKQKDEEWQRALREWNKVWREVDSKNYYRALDHQSVHFKGLDKKNTTTSKTLTTEIEKLRTEKKQRRAGVDEATTEPVRPLHQFEFKMADKDVLFDLLKLIVSFLDRDGAYSIPERNRVENFLRQFVPMLFGVAEEEMDANLGQRQDTPDGEEEERGVSEQPPVASDDESSVVAEKPTSSVGGGPRSKPTSSAGPSAARVGNKLAATLKKMSRHPSPSPMESESGAILLGEQTWLTLRHPHKAEEDNAPTDDWSEETPRRFNLFANATFYCLVRIIHTLYQRLITFKQDMAKLAADNDKPRLNPIAIKLGLAVPIPVIDSEVNPAARYYEHSLDLAEKLFDNEIDQNTYEEHLRYMGGIHVFPLFTIDKLIATIIKHIHTINSDAKCQDVFALLEKDRARQHTTLRQQIAYRMEAEAVVGAEENLYRIEWIPDVKTLTIQLMGKEDLTMDDAYDSPLKKQEAWMASFALMAATEGVGAQVKAPLLKRNRTISAAEDPQDFDLAPALEATVEDPTYRLAYVGGTEDYLHRRRPVVEGREASLQEAKDRRQRRFKAWLQSRQTEDTPMDDDF